MEMLQGYKTILFNALLVLTGVLAEMGIALPADFAQDINGAILAIVGVAGVALRAVTTGPIGGKE